MSGTRTALSSRAAIALLCAVVVGALLTGCADSSKWLETEPAAHFSASGPLEVPDQLKNYIVLHCLQTEPVTYAEKGEDAVGQARPKEHECMYVGVEVNKLFAAQLDTDGPNALIATLLSVSDMNCSNFMNRVFAARSSSDFTKGFLQDLTTAFAAGAAPFSGSAAAGLNGVNLVVGKGFQNLESTYYANQAFEAIEAAIISERSDRRSVILVKQDNNDLTGSKHVAYPVEAILADVRAYDDACSIRGGLARLANIANQAKDSDVSKNKKVELAAPGSKGAVYNGSG